ncbi:Protein N-acetyltransferase, RimJ/RimL family [Streptoalloteichus tenebrarius]|uniref:Protein N-acetyltransferase, RimJ/RimL family n=1 Tax=Streptoalloteichus tenebrarius (strain ATCC 17920 / DSM 40477 / JCM 4838 / CBS 697.72 / NBRC 16177 / NCIMB 11028 / NRRL B-12390 / A12253. 1 / ISP 5477) TaxID=1933 RepID=A0ABT1HRE8_STRSD|nr:GNAT family N-acetyltransferase [Streptoalloteichus tenebrarius]MCP2258099.1 Protein N-acetyltransferase, RimJ/RimL family [Streptoalloteichus tenebrarius]BFF01773.1 GNAT family protein [Streptoalloteichus tenebrarius]
MAETPDPWPLRHLVLRTPRLELRPDDDPGLLELAEEARLGVHPPDEMPFAVPWSDAPAEELGRNILQFHWSQRAALRPDDWSVHFLVRRDGRVIGTQGISAKDFAVTGEVRTGSWLGRRHQGRGYGVEMRAAVLQFAFSFLGARQARSDAFEDNAASLAVSRKLGYVDDGTDCQARRGRLAVQRRLLLTGERFAEHSPGWRVDVAGVDGCLPVLGVRHRRSTP